jgi:hypothetical protein
MDVSDPRCLVDEHGRVLVPLRGKQSASGSVIPFGPLTPFLPLASYSVVLPCWLACCAFSYETCLAVHTGCVHWDRAVPQSAWWLSPSDVPFRLKSVVVGSANGTRSTVCSCVLLH